MSLTNDEVVTFLCSPSQLRTLTDVDLMDALCSGVNDALAIYVADVTLASAFVTPAPEGRRYGAHAGDGPGTVISPAFARYEWDGETGYGGLERSALRTAITFPAAGGQEDERKS